MNKVNSLGFVWDTRDYVTLSWEERFAHLERYVEAHGDARVPQRFKTEDGYKLGTWVQSQRNSRSTMSAERVTRLDALGFVWDTRSCAEALTVSRRYGPL